MNIKKSGLNGRKTGDNKIVPGQFKGGAGELSGGVTAAGSVFSSFLDAEHKKYTVEEIRKMIESLESHALKIYKSPTFKLYDEYRNKIKTILQQICTNLYKVKDNVSSQEASDKLPSNFLVVISKVDEALGELEEKFRQKANFSFLAKHSEIKGMLLDALY
ncbi:MAG: hypothetical protein A2008_04250 [Candidatus Wallbacteria bacterium GWC2_49_35]|uniref:DUF327 domain-containing protein n=1 Tax=Candidatus Wallbacteria bacterium GWC2_49_35 TaxID=1817813 RepID=A0A1F7WM52_9BACT|nr:MAG: hypothetical protein A2008_04250 [Candidatus Wallbacteria bacterium GWC2_49_35]HBC75113.1 hypothetical protein [Candidatus Wallbacteria bacterium]